MLATMAFDGRNSMVEYCMRRGANPNARASSHLRYTGLACAAAFANEETIRLLLDYVATLNGSGALVFAAEREKVANVNFVRTKGAGVDEMGVEDPGDRRSRARMGVSYLVVMMRDGTH
jgi:ankyrin repeat protein